MMLAAFAILACLAGPALSIPIDYPDYGGVDLDSYYSPCRGVIIRGDCVGIGWPFSRYGPWPASDALLNPTALGADILNRYPNDYYYPGYPRSVNYAKENFVRGDVFGTTEYGTRNEVTVRDGYRCNPYPKFNPFCYPWNILRNCGYPLPAPFPGPVFPFGAAGTRITDVATDWNGLPDSLYLRR